VGSLLGVQPLDDPNRTKVDMIAESLGLERVGYIFTSLNKEKQFMTSNQLREIARLQQQHIVDHPAGYKVSKFVTVRVE
jgi:nuclear protein localization family protein 4